MTSSAHPIDAILSRLEKSDLADRITVFGSVARGTTSPGDLDIVVDLRPLTSDEARRQDPRLSRFATLLGLAWRHYGSFDPFLRFGDTLIVRDDDARGWIRAKHARAILKNVDREGIPLAQAIELRKTIMTVANVQQSANALPRAEEPLNGGRPCLGASVNEVLNSFRDLCLARHHPQHGPAAWVQAIAMWTDKGQLAYRFMPDGLHVVRAQLGQRTDASVATSKASDREYTELEENLAAGSAQISMVSRVNGREIVLHQATGRQLPMDRPATPAPSTAVDAADKTQTSTWVVLYRPAGAKPLDEPEGFVCSAADMDSADALCEQTHPGCDLLWAEPVEIDPQGNEDELRQAIRSVRRSWYESGSESDEPSEIALDAGHPRMT